MRQSTTSTIKREQRKSFLLRTISPLIHKITTEEPHNCPELGSTYITRIDLSADGGICYVYFWSAQGEESFSKTRGTLILYKPSLRTALAKALQKKYTPDLLFLFDTTHEKEIRINELLDQVQNETEDLSS